MKHKLLSKLKISFAIVLVVVALVLAYLVTPWFGNKVLIVRSGSMSPILPVGSLVGIRPKELISSPLPAVPRYSPGDIISFKDPHNSKIITTHRVVSYKIENYQVLYETKGDANQTPDQTLVAEKNILGTTFLSLPYLGILFSFTKTKTGFLILVLIPALMVIILESWNIFKEVRKKRPLRYTYLKNFRINQNPTLTSLIPLLAVGLVFAQTSAYFSDTAHSTNNVFASASTFPPGPGDIVINEINWAGNNTSTADEWVELRNTTSSSIDITNWVIENLGDSSPTTFIITSGVIPANGFFLVANFNQATSKINVGPDIADTAVSLLNEGEQLVLKNSSAVTIDTANQVGAWFEGRNSPEPKLSMERKTPPGDGTQAANWQTATTHTNMDGSTSTDEFGTPKAANGL